MPRRTLLDVVVCVAAQYAAKEVRVADVRRLNFRNSHERG